MKRSTKRAPASRAAPRRTDPVPPKPSLSGERTEAAPGPPAGRGLSPRWTASAKLLIGLTVIVVAGALIFRFSSLIQLLIVAGIVSFLASPLVRILDTRTRLSWRAAAHLVFLTLIVLLIVAFTVAGFALAQETQSLVRTVQVILLDIPEMLESLSGQILVLGPFRLDLAGLDLASLADQAVVYVRPILGEMSGWVTVIAGGAIESIARTVFVLAAAYYLTLDQLVLNATWKRSVIPGFEYDWNRLRRGLDRVWAAFLRGQIVLGLVIAVVVTIGLSILGVSNALVLGLVSGLLEFIPLVGPVVAGGIAALVAFFQGSNWWGLQPWVFTLIVIAFFIVVQQLENNLLVPRILGTALRLNPVVVLIAAVIGASLAGILGILLSAPTTATLIFLGRYVQRKIFDQNPWDPPIDGILDEPPKGSG